MKPIYRLVLVVLFSLFISCNKKPGISMNISDKPPLEAREKITRMSYGHLKEGTEIFLYQLENDKGMQMRVINYGGIIVSLTAPDKHGNYEDVVLGYDSLSAYEADQSFFGALIGRYANRIAKGRFVLDGRVYNLSQNNMGNHLHGGNRGFHKVVWKVEPHSSAEGAGLTLSYESKDMEEGYPGNLQVKVTYILTDNNELKITYQAVTDKATIVNLMHHGYFNLSGDFGKDILDHELRLNADKFLPVDNTLIPLGELQDVAGSPFDFRTLHPIGSRINVNQSQLQIGKGYDHCWVLNKMEKQGYDDILTLAAELYDYTSLKQGGS
jgi:aldose 1-epimerase